MEGEKILCAPSSLLCAQLYIVLVLTYRCTVTYTKVTAFCAVGSGREGEVCDVGKQIVFSE